MCPSGMLRGRASAGAACWRASEKGTSKEGHAASRCFVFGRVPDGGCSPEGVGRVCRSDQGGCSVLSAERRGGGLWGAPSGGHRACCSLLSAWGDDGPPLVQHRPRVTYSGTAKGPLLGGLPIVSGLEGVCDVEEKKGLNPAACCENAWSGVKALEKKRGMGRGGYCCCSGGGGAPPFPRPARLGVGCKRRGGCPRGEQ